MNTPKRRKITLLKNPFIDDLHNNSLLTSTPPPLRSISTSSPPHVRGYNPFNSDSIISEAENNCEAFNNLYLDSLLYSSNDTFTSSINNMVYIDPLDKVKEYIFDYEKKNIDHFAMKDGRENPFGIDIYSRF